MGRVDLRRCVSALAAEDRSVFSLLLLMWFQKEEEVVEEEESDCVVA